MNKIKFEQLGLNGLVLHAIQDLKFQYPSDIQYISDKFSFLNVPKNLADVILRNSSGLVNLIFLKIRFEISLKDGKM